MKELKSSHLPPHHSHAALLLNRADSIAGDTNQMAMWKCLALPAHESCLQGPVSVQLTLALQNFFILVKMANKSCGSQFREQEVNNLISHLIDFLSPASLLFDLSDAPGCRCTLYPEVPCSQDIMVHAFVL